MPEDVIVVSTLPEDCVTRLTSCPAVGPPPELLSVNPTASLGLSPILPVNVIVFVFKPCGAAIFGS